MAKDVVDHIAAVEMALQSAEFYIGKMEGAVLPVALQALVVAIRELKEIVPDPLAAEKAEAGVLVNSDGVPSACMRCGFLANFDPNTRTWNCPRCFIGGSY